MPEYSMQVKTFPTSNLAEDASVNTWSFVAEDLDAMETASNAILDFHQACLGFYPSLVRQNDHQFKVYARADPEPRAPVREGTWNFASAPTGFPLPTECALVVSFQAASLSGVPQSRRRGRVYIGPLDAGLVGTDGLLSNANAAALADVADALLTASLADITWYWGVYSTVENSTAEVTNGWVNNEFDTQRRRGRNATFRAVYP